VNIASRRPKLSDERVLRKFRNPRDGFLHVQLTLGDTYVTSDPDEVLTTILGSCIAACIRDTSAKVGGMNHFLLPDGNSGDRSARCYGVNAMELLINDILKHGGDRRRLEAKLFGGANVVSALTDVGSRNIAFARQFLNDEGITIVGGDVGGDLARRIQFAPASGRARQAVVKGAEPRLVEEELSALHKKTQTAAAADVEFF
jgi:chemotaxis protein CheD